MPNTTMSSGLPCDNYKGYCDTLGKCEPVDMDGPMKRLYHEGNTFIPFLFSY